MQIKDFSIVIKKAQNPVDSGLAATRQVNNILNRQVLIIIPNNNMLAKLL
jgi:hypothetical protein